MEETRFRLCGEFAKPYLRSKVGDKVTLRLEAVVTSIGLEPDYSQPPAVSGDEDEESGPPAKRAVCEFVVARVNGKSGESYADMEAGEIEDEIADVKEGKTSVWTQMREQEKLTKIPFKRRPSSLIVR